MIKLNCPNCGAPLEFSKKNDYFFCMYCGQKIIIKDPNKYTIEYIHHEINEANIRQAEAEERKSIEQIAALKEYNHNILRVRRRILQIWIISLVILLVLSFIPAMVDEGVRVLLVLDILLGIIVVPILLLIFHNKKR